jgi:hypothetical protein
MKPVAFIEPMECLAVSNLPKGAQWIWESNGTAIEQRP